MLVKSEMELEAVGKIIKTIRLKLESMPVRNSKIMKSPEVLDRLETLVDNHHDRLAIEKLVNFLGSITLAPIKQEITQLKHHLKISY